jgi:DNA-binding NarL/FixJ family response regulator
MTRDHAAATPATPATSAVPATTAAPALTERETEVLLEIARGARDKEIAARLDLSLHTVHSHVKHVLAKLGARSRTEAAARFLQ